MTDYNRVATPCRMLYPLNRGLLMFVPLFCGMHHLCLALLVSFGAAVCNGEAMAVSGAKDVIVRGEIRDTSGNLLDGVTCGYSALSGARLADNIRTTSATMNGVFEWHEQKVLNFMAVFRKPGYYADVRKFDHSDSQWRAAEGTYSTSFTVVMEKEAADEPKLVEKSALIGGFSSSPPYTLGVKANGVFDDKIRESEFWQATTNVIVLSTPADMLTSALGVSSPTFAIRKVPRLDYATSPSQACLIPRNLGCQIKLVLLCAEASDGLVLCHEAGEVDTGHYPIETGLAPADGYTPEIDVSDAVFCNPLGAVYCFYRVNGKYGKCKLKSGHINPGGIVSVGFRSLANPTGSRDLRSPHKYRSVPKVD
ncbi:MAG: hypothetical protein K1X53_09685 [Candidatus Sumerlaeaceae bacterium]|nr:hypothetical protein [Candidatus Sumerlaeaceae bacterium]